jgi:hypothetical protein
MKKELRTKRIDSRIRPSLYNKVEKEAQKHKWSISTFVEDALIRATTPTQQASGIPDRELRKMLKVKPIKAEQSAK